MLWPLVSTKADAPRGTTHQIFISRVVCVARPAPTCVLASQDMPACSSLPRHFFFLACNISNFCAFHEFESKTQHVLSPRADERRVTHPNREDINITRFSELREILTETYFFSTSTFLLLEIAAPRRLHIKSVPHT